MILLRIFRKTGIKRLLLGEKVSEEELFAAT